MNRHAREIVPLLLITLLMGCDQTRFIRVPVAPSPSSSDPSSPPAPPSPHTPPPPAIAGNYTLTASAAACAPIHPAAFRTRSYAARVEQNDRTIEVVLSGLSLDRGARTAGYQDGHIQKLWGEIRPDGSVFLTNYLGNEQWNFVADQVTPSDLLTILVDDARVISSANGLSGSFAGSFVVYPEAGDRWCYAVNHELAFSR